LIFNDDPNTLQGFFIIETTWFVLFVTMLELYRRLHAKDKLGKTYQQLKQRNESIEVASANKQLLQDLSANLSKEYLDKTYPGRLIAIFLNKVYDITNLSHPGGNLSWKNQNWQEISRYMYGSNNDEKDRTVSNFGHTHSLVGYKWLEKYCYLGTVEPLLDEAWPLVDKNNTPTYSDSKKWSKVNSVDLNSSTKLYEFKNEEFKINLLTKGVKYFGLSWNITDTVTKKTRCYTTCISLSLEYASYRKWLLKKYWMQQNSSTENESANNTLKVNT